jgi:uncharacterized metal-binding protein
MVLIKSTKIGEISVFFILTKYKKVGILIETQKTAEGIYEFKESGKEFNGTAQQTNGVRVFV